MWARSRYQVSMPATMKSPGRLKLRKLSTPIASVNATATSAYTLPSTRPLTSCCSIMLGDMRHHALGAGDDLLEELHGVRERAGRHVSEESVVDGAQLRHQLLDALAPGGGHAEQRAARIMRIGAPREQP